MAVASRFGLGLAICLILRLPFVFSAPSIDSINKGGFIGCLFNKDLCHAANEWCHDDGLFGRCVPHADDDYDMRSVMKNVELDDEAIAVLEAALAQLDTMDYNWSDIMTQCTLQRLISNFETGEEGSPDHCLLLYENGENDSDDMIDESDLVDGPYANAQSMESAPPYLTKGELESQSVSKDKSQLSDDVANDGDDRFLGDGGGPLLLVFKKRQSSPTSEDFVEATADENLSQRLSEILANVQDDRPLFNVVGPIIDGNSDEEDDFSLSSSLYTNPKFERQERLDVKKPGPWFTVNNYAFEDTDEVTADEHQQDHIQAQLDDLPMTPDDYLYDTNEYEPISKDHHKSSVDSLSVDDELHHLAFEQLLQSLTDQQDVEQIQDTTHTKTAKPHLVDFQSDLVSVPLPKREVTDDDQEFQDSVREKDVNNATSPRSSLKMPNSRDQVSETDYAFITTQETSLTEKQAALLLKILTDLLHLPQDALTDIRVRDNRITFRVLPNDKGMDSTYVAARTDEMREQIQRLSGLRVDATGIGDQTEVSSVLFWSSDSRQMALTVTLCVLASAVLLAAVVLFLVRRRYQAHQKLKDLTQSVEGEVTRDYQDLCRARMATKAAVPQSEHGKELSKTHPQTFASRDSESSRSSTSSWCEEPVVSNMDISTGHMVLSYMEDHLRNKDRLNQEWQALCAYEAEPSTSTLHASKPENMGKNRCPDVIPYDHSRVVLGTLANVTGSDYINASSIADHDPRHPAYIAAQAPVEDSTADFWQLVWEQGSVVLVLLTKLNENGQEMCHRYWPEEGSRLYHIYEVHLVSEHIWCDDYLVRSFYLKNIRTGETRTVTQFHFLSWPENGVPLSTKALLEFRRKVNKSYRGRSCPIVVHCSDGAGRSGTYCLIDMVLHRMAKGAREIDIAATLEHLRDQRPQTVRTKQQFEFVLTAVAEEVHAILRALPQ